MSDSEFLFHYRFGGAEWGITIHAADEVEAKQKIKQVCFARYQGEVAARIHVPNRLARFVHWLTGSSRPLEQPALRLGPADYGACAGERAEEIPGTIPAHAVAVNPHDEAFRKFAVGSKPSHIICLGWPAIRQLAKEGVIWDSEHEAGIVAADDLFAFDFTEYRYGPKAKRR